MPWLSPHPCRSPGCGILIRGHVPYCSQHRTAARQREDERRPSASARGYDVDWRRRRAAFLEEHPDCRVCAEPATEVDHIVPLRQGGADDESNWQPLCKTHHSIKTGRHDRGRGTILPRG